MFPDIAYLDWITGRPEAATHDLGSSDLRRAVPEPDGIVPPELEALPSPPDDLDLETIIVDAYDVGTENVLVTAGATHANFIAMAAALGGEGTDGAGETDGGNDHSPRALVEKPGYEPLVATPEGLGATIDRFRRPAEEGYELDPERIESAMRDGTRCIVVTNRHNPTGSRASRETMEEASRAAADNDAVLLVDEVYAPFCSDEASVFGGPTAAMLPNTVITNSMTKFLGFGPVRVGWLVADADFVARAQSVMFHVPAISAPGMALTRRALYADADLAKGSRGRIEENQELLTEFVEGRDDISGAVPSGCTFGFFAHESADGDEISEAAWEEEILVVPGRFFDDSDSFRLSLGLDNETVSAGLDAFGDVLDEISAKS